MSGDARRALDICRRATEIAEETTKDKTVSMMHVQKALNEMIATLKVQAIKKCSKLEKLFLQAVAAEVSTIFSINIPHYLPFYFAYILKDYLYN